MVHICSYAATFFHLRFCQLEPWSAFFVHPSPLLIVQLLSQLWWMIQAKVTTTHMFLRSCWRWPWYFLPRHVGCSVESLGDPNVLLKKECNVRWAFLSQRLSIFHPVERSTLLQVVCVGTEIVGANTSRAQAPVSVISLHARLAVPMACEMALSQLKMMSKPPLWLTDLEWWLIGVEPLRVQARNAKKTRPTGCARNGAWCFLVILIDFGWFWNDIPLFHGANAGIPILLHTIDHYCTLLQLFYAFSILFLVFQDVSNLIISQSVPFQELCRTRMPRSLKLLSQD